MKQISESTSPGNESLMIETWLVKDAKPCPTMPVIPVANSMNFFTTSKVEQSSNAPTYRALSRSRRAHNTEKVFEGLSTTSRVRTYAMIASLADTSSMCTSLASDLKRFFKMEDMAFG